MAVWREHRVPDPLDAPVALEPAETSEQHLSADGERGQSKRVGERPVGVAQHREGEVEPLGQLTLVRGLLGAQAEDASAEDAEVLRQVAEGAGLGSAAAGAGMRSQSGTRGRCPG